VRRIIGESVSDEALASLTAADLGLLPGEGALSGLAPQADTSAAAGRADLGDAAVLSPSYRAALDSLGVSLAERGGAVEIVAEPEALRRAMQVRRALAPGDTLRSLVDVRTGGEAPREQAASLRREAIPERSVFVTQDPPQLGLHLIVSNVLADSVAGWTFLVDDADTGATVARRDGAGPLPERLVWDWQTLGGDLVTPGIYRYALQWTDTAGRTYETPPRTVRVRKVQRSTTIELRTQPREIPADAGKIKLLIRE
jgi:hypothetical protein